MIRKLKKHGNGQALIIPKSILKLLDIGPKTELNITIDDTGTELVITPIRENSPTQLKPEEQRQGDIFVRGPKDAIYSKLEYSFEDLPYTPAQGDAFLSCFSQDELILICRTLDSSDNRELSDKVQKIANIRIDR